MPIVTFDSLPDSARIWVFASDRQLEREAANELLAAVDEYLSTWSAHGAPLRCAREWRDDRFLAIAVDVTAENASGCSIDGLFRRLQQLERHIGTRLVGGGRVFYRSQSRIETSSQAEFVDRLRHGDVEWETPVFDTSLTAASEWRSRFEKAAGEVFLRSE